MNYFKKISLFLLFGITITTGLFFAQNKAHAFGECSEYGAMVTYDPFTHNCKCMSGYVFRDNQFGGSTCVSQNDACHDQLGYNSSYNLLDRTCECSYGYVIGTDSMGNTACVSANSVCYKKYGYHSTYNSFDKSCECSSGYVFGKNSQCVSLDSTCTDQLGYFSRYNSVYDKCECLSGYVIDDAGNCTDGDIVCHSKNGYNSSYTSYTKTCDCDTGYTLDETNQCVKKQNNVYFTLKELDTDNKQAIIKSGYDYRYYLITYNSGCYSSSFRRYIGHQIVVNLGTDYNLDTWDKIVLQDDDETCDITHKESADSSSTLELKEPETLYTPTPLPVPPISIKEPPKSINLPSIPLIQKTKIVEPKPLEKEIFSPTKKQSTTTVKTNSTGTTSNQKVVKKENFFTRIWKKLFSWF